VIFIIITWSRQGCNEQKPYPLPVMKVNPVVKDIFGFRFEDFTLENYQSHPAIKATGGGVNTCI